MKILYIIAILLPFIVVGQPNMSELRKTFSDSSYADFDLSKVIKIKNDFDQTTLSDSEIESKIAAIIKNQNSESLLEIETPINSKKLLYLGKVHPTKTNVFYEDYNYFVNQDQAIKNNLFYTYKYENLFIATLSNTLIDRYLVYYAIRGYLILKYRFPEINKFLFEKPQQLPYNFLITNPKPAFINTTKNIFIMFDGSLQLPSNNAYFGSKHVSFSNPCYGIEVYPNTQIMYFNRKTVINGGAAGVIPIYSTITDTAQKFHTYMKDGFIHSFVHERIHDWIFQYKNLNPLADYLRNKCVESETVENYYPFEEAVVNNTTNILFEMNLNNGGLSNAILKFYRKEFELSISSFKADGSYQKLKTYLANYNTNILGTSNLYINSFSYNIGDQNKLLFIDFYDIKNVP